MASSAAMAFESFVNQHKSDIQMSVPKDLKADFQSKVSKELKTHIDQSISDRVNNVVNAELQRVNATVATLVSSEVQRALQTGRGNYTTEFEDTKKQTKSLTRRLDALDKKLQETTKSTAHFLPTAEKVMDLKIAATEKSMRQNHTCLEQRLPQDIEHTQEALASQVDKLTDISGEVKNLGHEISKMFKLPEPFQESHPIGDEEVVPDLIFLGNEAPLEIFSESQGPLRGKMADNRSVDEGKAKKADPKNPSLASLFDNLHVSSDENDTVALKRSAIDSPDAGDEAYHSMIVNDDSIPLHQRQPLGAHSDEHSQTSVTSLDDNEITLSWRERRSY